MDLKELAGWLGERLDKLETKVDGVGERCSHIDVTLAGQAKDIAHHIARTDALESRVEQVAEEQQPLREFHAKILGVGAFLSVIAVVTGIAAAIANFIA